MSAYAGLKFDAYFILGKNGLSWIPEAMFHLRLVAANEKLHGEMCGVHCIISKYHDYFLRNDAN